jgi:hypothetical protein
VCTVVETEVSAWENMTRAMLKYCIAAVDVPDELREHQVRGESHGTFVATGQLLRRLTPEQLEALPCAIRDPLDHDDIRRAIRALEREQSPTSPSLLLWTLAGVGAKR